MKRLIGITAIVLSLGASMSARAHDVPDGVDCAERGGGIYVDALRSRRGAVCVGDHRGNVILYAGGSLQAQEDQQRDHYTQACGAIIVANQPVAGNPDWDRVDEDGTAHHCD